MNSKKKCAVVVAALIGVILMLISTAAYKTAISNTQGRNIKARVSVAYTYPFIGNLGITYTSSPESAISSRGRVTNGVGYLDYYNGGTQKNGFVSLSVCDGSGVFSPAPLLTVFFPTAQNFTHWEVTGDLTSGQYPVDYTIQFRNAALAVFKTITVTANTDVQDVHDFAATTAITRSVILTVTKWSVPNTTCKIASFTPRTMGYYDGEDILSMDVVEQIESASREILGTAISKTLNMKLSLLDGIIDSTKFKPNAVIIPEIGATLSGGALEFEPMGWYYLIDKRASDDKTILTIEANDIFTVISNYDYNKSATIFDDGFTGETFMTDIITRAGVGLPAAVVSTAAFYVTTSFMPGETAVSIQGTTVRDWLTWCGEIAMGYENAPSYFGIGYFQTSKYKNQVNLINRIIKSTGHTFVRDIRGDNIFKLIDVDDILKNPNIIRVSSMDGNDWGPSIDAASIALYGDIPTTVCQGNRIIVNDFIEAATINIALNYLVGLQGTRVYFEWQGDTSLEVGDLVSVYNPDESIKYDGYIVSNSYLFDGGLRCSTTIKVLLKTIL
jgi:hypothetical protein